MIAGVAPQREIAKEHFWQKDDDNALLLDRVSIAIPVEEALVSRPFNAKVMTIQKWRYQEIETCLKILRGTQANRPCRRTFMESKEEITRLWTCRNPAFMLCALGVPAVLLSGWLLHHFYLVHERIIEIQGLKKILSPAIDAWKLFMGNYTPALHTLQSRVYADQNISQLFGTNATALRNWLVDACQVCTIWVELRISAGWRHPLIEQFSSLHRLVKELACDRRFDCCPDVNVCQFVLNEMSHFDPIVQANNLAQAAVDDFIRQKAAEKTQLEASVVDLQAQIDVPEHSLWSTPLGICLFLSCIFSIGYILYLCRSLYSERSQAQEELNTAQYLEENIRSEFVPRMITLCAQLDVPIDLPLDDMIKFLELKQADHELLFASFCKLKQLAMPHDLIRLILQKMSCVACHQPLLRCPA